MENQWTDELEKLKARIIELVDENAALRRELAEAHAMIRLMKEGGAHD